MDRQILDAKMSQVSLTWRCTDGNADIDIEATTAQEAAEIYAHGGDWEPEASTWWCHVTCTPLDDDGEPIEDEEEDIAVAMDPEEPDCDEHGEHDWCSPEWLGGCDSNPGVWGHGGGVKITEVCSKCGLYRVIDTWAQDRATGERFESVEYREGDDYSLQWADSQAGEYRDEA